MALPGGNYTAVRHEDGTYDVLDVPIFGEHTRDFGNGEKIVVDRAWLDGAVRKAQARYQLDKYLPPLHVHHHSGAQTEPAGQFRVKRVEQIPYQGKPTWFILADLVNVPGAIFERMKAGLLAYRSVELADLEAQEIDSCALMPDRTPFFRLPMLTIGKVVDAQVPAGANFSVLPCARASYPMVAFAYQAGTKRHAVLYSEAPMPDDTSKDQKPADQKPPEDKKPVQAQEGESAMSECVALLKAIAAKLGIGAGSPTSPEPTPQAGAAAGAPAEMQAGPAAVEMTALKARVVASEGKVAELERTLTAKDLVATAMGKLKGYALGPTAEAELLGIARAKGQAGVDSFVSTLHKYGRKEPGPDTTGAPDSLSGAAEVPAEVKEYEAKGPEAFQAALKFSKLYDEVGTKTRTTRSQFIKAQFFMAERGVPVVGRN